MTLGQVQEMSLTLNTRISSITQLVLHLPTFRSQAAIFSEKSTVFTFTYRKAQVEKFDLGRVTSVVFFFISMYPNANIQNLVENGHVVSEKMIFNLHM